jgi:hypothetical protein
MERHRIDEGEAFGLLRAEAAFAVSSHRQAHPSWAGGSWTARPDGVRREWVEVAIVARQRQIDTC